MEFCSDNIKLTLPTLDFEQKCKKVSHCFLHFPTQDQKGTYIANFEYYYLETHSSKPEIIRGNTTWRTVNLNGASLHLRRLIIPILA